MSPPRMAYPLAVARSRRHVPTSRREPAGTSQQLGRAFPDFTYIICTTPRSGSWLLSEGLASTSRAGNPREWFNVLEEQKYRAQWRMEHSSDLPFAQYLRLVAENSTSRNGVSGLKLHYYQFAQLPEIFESVPGCRELSPAGILAKAFPHARYIWLTRRDKARQAVSLFLASRTGEWWRIGEERSRGSAAEAAGADFDPAAVMQLERLLTGNDASWQAFFRDNRITPLVAATDALADVTAKVVDGQYVPTRISATGLLDLLLSGVVAAAGDAATYGQLRNQAQEAYYSGSTDTVTSPGNWWDPATPGWTTYSASSGQATGPGRIAPVTVAPWTWRVLPVPCFAAVGSRAGCAARFRTRVRAFPESGTSWGRRLWLAGGLGRPCLVCRVGVLSQAMSLTAGGE